MTLNRPVPAFLLVCIGAGLVFGCAEKKDPEFTSYAVIQAASRILPNSPSGAEGIMNQDVAFGMEVQTVAATARTYDLMKRYWSRLQRDGLAEKIAAPYLGTRPYSADLGFSIFERHADVRPERLTMLVRFSFSHHDPEIARAVADTMALEYLAFESESEAHEANPYYSRLISHAFPAQN